MPIGPCALSSFRSLCARWPSLFRRLRVCGHLEAVIIQETAGLRVCGHLEAVIIQETASGCQGIRVFLPVGAVLWRATDCRMRIGPEK